MKGEGKHQDYKITFDPNDGKSKVDLVKNIVAIAIGMLDGAGYTDNTKAFMLTACLQEMVTFAENLGAKKRPNIQN